jgi:hydroxyacylglutathione hydrolase
MQPVIEPFVSEELSNSAYLVGSPTTQAAVLIDPLRDVDRYLAAAERLGLTIHYVLETHLHADFISGAREIAARTGATIGASAAADLGFDYRPLVEGDRLSLGDLALGVLATPGHTPEHIAFTLAATGTAEPTALFSGGALMVGGAARTDLIHPELTDSLTRQLHHTLQHKLMALPDAVGVYPTHGAGSFCAAPATGGRTSTIGHERLTNPLAQVRDEDRFVELALRGLPSYPVYYRELRAINRRGPRLLGDLPRAPALEPEAVAAWMAQGGALLDVRPARVFAEAHIPDSYGIALDAPLATWAGWLIPFGTSLVLLAGDAHELDEAVRQLACIGYDDVRGYLAGGLPAWERAGLPVSTIRTIAPAALHERLASAPGAGPLVLDVRHDAEWRAGHIPGALHIENGRLPYLPDEELPFARDREIVVLCQHRDRSTAGLAVLARRGYQNLYLLEGGFAAWEAADLTIQQNASATRPA